MFAQHEGYLLILGGDTSRPYPGDTNPASDSLCCWLYLNVAGKLPRYESKGLAL